MLVSDLFRRKDAADLRYAVPENVPVPALATDHRWEYTQSLHIGPLSRFDMNAAHVSAGTYGFYRFHSAS